MTVHASELYPTLGPLLELLCRNPVVMAASSARVSGSDGLLAELVAQSVIKFSTRSSGGTGSSRNATAVGIGSSKSLVMTRMAQGPSTEQSWRAARMRDMFRAQQNQKLRQDKYGKKTTRAGDSNWERASPIQNGPKKADKDIFQDLFKVLDKEMKEKETELTLETMVDNLTSLQDQVADTELTEVAWNSLVVWNRQLSGLCAPLASAPNAADLIEGIIRTTYLLYSKRPQSTFKAMSLQLLDSSFVQSLMLSDSAVSAAFKEGPTLAQLLFVSPLARQGFLVQLIGTIIQDCGYLSDFYQSRQQIIQRHFESSQFLASAVSGQLSEDQHRHLIERLLEDSAELAGEIDDWRVVRIWTLFIEWILRRLGTIGLLRTLPSEPDSSAMDQDADLWAIISSACRIVNISHLKSTGSTRLRLSVNSAVLSEISNLLEIQSRYVFETAPPQEMALRRRMVFLVGSAVAMSNRILTSLIYQHILLLDKPDCHHNQDGLPLEPSQDSATLLNVLSLLMCGETGAASTSTISKPFMALLKDLHSTLQMSETSNPYDLRLGTVAELEGIFVRHLPFLRLNAVVIADIVCAAVVYNDPENSAFWQSVISTILRILTGQESTPLLTTLPAFMARLRDLAETLSVSGLTAALDTLLAAHARRAAGTIVTLPMDTS
ncbi:hypothetical protein BGW39_001009 [Mortierella sp. 14UC]|nr:hypothetical protein BGW39_001009 [Mortierella sp. 14UC]